MAAAAAGGEGGGGYGRRNGDDDEQRRIHPFRLNPLHVSEACRPGSDDDDNGHHAQQAGLSIDVAGNSVDVPVEGGTGGASAPHGYRGVRTEQNGTYVSYLYCRNPPARRSMKVWLGRFSTAASAAMAYDVFSVYNHHDSLVNFPENLHIYLRFVPRRGIDVRGALAPLHPDYIEKVKHIGVGIIRAFYPNTHINVDQFRAHRSPLSKREYERRAAEYVKLEQTTRDSVHSLIDNQQGAALNLRNPTLNMASAALNSLDLSSIQIPYPPHPSIAYNADQPQGAMSPSVRQTTAHDWHMLSRDRLRHYDDPSRHPVMSSHRFGHTTSRFTRTRSYKEDAQDPILSHRRQSATEISHRRFSDPGAFLRFDKYDGEEAYQHGLENAPMEQQVNAKAGPSRQSGRHLPVHADPSITLRQGLLACSAVNAKNRSEQKELYSPQEPPSHLMYDFMGCLDHQLALKEQRTQGNDVSSYGEDQQKTVPLQRQIPSQLQLFDVFKSPSNEAAMVEGGGPDAISLPSIEMQVRNNEVDSARQVGSRSEGSLNMVIREMQASNYLGDDRRNVHMRSEDSVNMVIREPFVRGPFKVPDLNLPPPEEKNDEGATN